MTHSYSNKITKKIIKWSGFLKNIRDCKKYKGKVNKNTGHEKSMQ